MPLKYAKNVSSKWQTLRCIATHSPKAEGPVLGHGDDMPLRSKLGIHRINQTGLTKRPTRRKFSPALPDFLFQQCHRRLECQVPTSPIYAQESDHHVLGTGWHSRSSLVRQGKNEIGVTQTATGALKSKYRKTLLRQFQLSECRCARMQLNGDARS